METSEEKQIIKLILDQETSERGFRLLITAYQERLYWHIRKFVTDHEDANDVLQNTYVKVYKSITRFEGKSKLYTWLYRIATNEALTYVKRKSKRNTISVEENDIKLGERLKADEYFDGDQIQIELQKALSRLPAKQKLVFQMRYYDEMSYLEISEVLTTSVGALKASYHHALKKIEHYLMKIEISIQ